MENTPIQDGTSTGRASTMGDKTVSLSKPSGARESGSPTGGSPTSGISTSGSPTGGSPTGEGRPAGPRGPNASAIVVGLVAIVLAGLLISREVLGLNVDWSRLGPSGIVGIGIVMVVIGAIGLVRRHDDV